MTMPSLSISTNSILAFFRDAINFIQDIYNSLGDELSGEDFVKDFLIKIQADHAYGEMPEAEFQAKEKNRIEFIKLLLMQSVRDIALANELLQLGHPDIAFEHLYHCNRISGIAFGLALMKSQFIDSETISAVTANARKGAQAKDQKIQLARNEAYRLVREMHIAKGRRIKKAEAVREIEELVAKFIHTHNIPIKTDISFDRKLLDWLGKMPEADIVFNKSTTIHRSTPKA